MTTTITGIGSDEDKNTVCVLWIVDLRAIHGSCFGGEGFVPCIALRYAIYLTDWSIITTTSLLHARLRY